MSGIQFVEPAPLLMKTRLLILIAALSPALLFAKPEVPPAGNPALNLWVDISLGLVTEEEMEEISAKADFKKTMEAETKAMKGNLHGTRKVSGKKLAAMVAAMDGQNSFSETRIIGKTKERAYLEHKVFIASGKAYVVVVWAPLDEVPEATRAMF